MKELLPCPLCGGNATRHPVIPTQINCTDCGLEILRDDAEEFWNNRVKPKKSFKNRLFRGFFWCFFIFLCANLPDKIYKPDGVIMEVQNQYDTTVKKCYVDNTGSGIYDWIYYSETCSVGDKVSITLSK